MKGTEAQFVVDFLGTAGSAPTASRSGPAVLCSAGGESLLVDCGEGVARQLTIATADVGGIVGCAITHPHADHYLGLGGLLALLEETGRTRPLTLLGPTAVAGLLGTFRGVCPVSFPLHLVALAAGDERAVGGFRIAAVRARHGRSALSFRIEAAGRALAVSGDTAPSPELAELAAGSELLVHEASFSSADSERAAETEHSTARDAALVALAAGVRLLALVHLSPRQRPSEARREARAVFPRTIVPRDFDRVLLGDDEPVVERAAVSGDSIRYPHVTSE